MKRQLFLVAMLVSVFSVSAEYINCFQEGMEWICNTSYMKYTDPSGAPEQDSYISRFYLAAGSGDYSSGQLVLFEENNTGTIALAAIECEGEKVYFRKSGIEGKYLMYDFGLNPGDEKEFFVIPYFKVTPVSFTAKCVGVEERIIGNRTFRIICFGNSYTVSDEKLGIVQDWISGIGSFSGVNYNRPDILPGASSSILLQARLNGELVFDSGQSGVKEIADSDNIGLKFYLPDGSVAPDDYKGIVISSEGKKILKK